jgi:threonine/homoserine/homoserine lactone efflux protein
LPILRAFLFGITIAAAVGPIAILLVTYGISFGPRVGALAGLGAALADFTYALVAFVAGQAILPLLDRNARWVHLVASAVLVAFGVWMVWGALRRKPNAEEGAAAATDRLRRPLMTVYALTIVNPLTVIAFLGFAVQLPLAGSFLRALAFSASLFAGSLLMQLTFGLGGAALGRIFSRGPWVRVLNFLSGAGIGIFGLWGLGQWL